MTAVVSVPHIDSDEIVDHARRFARDRFAHRVLELGNTHDYPYDVFDELAAAGYFGLWYGEEWGGIGVDLLTLCRVIEELAAVSNTVASLVMGQLQGSLPIFIAGNDDQRAAYLPDIVAGRKKVAMALTEPDAGSDVAAIRTLAVKDGDDYVLNGRKCFITMASVADVTTVYAKLEPGRSTATVQGFLIPKGTPGLIVGRLEEKMGSTALPTSEVVLDNCRVPAAWRLGEPGTGFRQAMQVLDPIRAVVGARAVGLARGAFEVATQYLTQRKAFDQPLSELQGLQFMVADMATNIEAARGLVQRACRAVMENDPDAPRYCAMAKYFGADTAMSVTTDAVQLLGGYGYMKDFPVEHRFREAKASQIVDGTNQIQRLVVARSVLKEAARAAEAAR